MAYKLAGLRIVSDFPLFWLPKCHELNGRHEVAIRHAPVPKTLLSVAGEFPNAQYNGNELLLKSPAAGRFLLRSGSEILIDPEPSSAEGEIRSFLLGTAFGALCHQRGILPLHSAVIDFENFGCVAFIGPSGAGKSTLAAVLSARGHQVIADDVCFLRAEERGSVQAWPGLSRIRLWEHTLTALGHDGSRLERELGGDNKYLIPTLPPESPTEPRPLRRIYQLHTGENGDDARMDRLQGGAVLEALLQNVYRLSLAEYMGQKPAAFGVCAAAALDIPAFRFTRPFDFGLLREGIELLEGHLREI